MAVPDARVDALTAKARPRKTIYASVDFIDIAGLVRGASKGEGLGNQFLGNIRECAAIVEVVRCFEDENVTHVDGSVSPLRDVETMSWSCFWPTCRARKNAWKNCRRWPKAARRPRRAAEHMQVLLAHLNAGKSARDFALPEHEAFLAAWRELGLLTAKPVIYCANVDEGAAPPRAMPWPGR